MPPAGVRGPGGAGLRRGARAGLRDPRGPARAGGRGAGRGRLAPPLTTSAAERKKNKVWPSWLWVRRSSKRFARASYVFSPNFHFSELRNSVQFHQQMHVNLPYHLTFSFSRTWSSLIQINEIVDSANVPMSPIAPPENSLGLRVRATSPSFSRSLNTRRCN